MDYQRLTDPAQTLLQLAQETARRRVSAELSADERPAAVFVTDFDVLRALTQGFRAEVGDLADDLSEAVSLRQPSEPEPKPRVGQLSPDLELLLDGELLVETGDMKKFWDHVEQAGPPTIDVADIWRALRTGTTPACAVARRIAWSRLDDLDEAPSLPNRSRKLSGYEQLNVRVHPDVFAAFKSAIAEENVRDPRRKRTAASVTESLVRAWILAKPEDR
jgi:hypothetical protein